MMKYLHIIDGMLKKEMDFEIFDYKNRGVL